MDGLIVLLVTGDDMQVQVGNLLSACLPVVDDQIGGVAMQHLPEFRVGCLGQLHQMAQSWLRARLQGRIGLFGDDQQMALVDRIYIEDGETKFVLVNFSSAY